MLTWFIKPWSIPSYLWTLARVHLDSHSVLHDGSIEHNIILSSQALTQSHTDSLPSVMVALLQNIIHIHLLWSPCFCSRLHTIWFPQHRGSFLKHGSGTSLVEQCLRICLPVQGTWVRSLVREDPTCRGATKPVRHNYWACALEPASHNYWSPHALEPTRCNCWAHVLQLPKPASLEPVLRNKKPPQWETRSPQLQKARTQQRRPNTAKNKNKTWVSKLFL